MLIISKLLLLLKPWFFYESFFAKPQMFLGIIVKPHFWKPYFHGNQTQIYQPKMEDSLQSLY